MSLGRYLQPLAQKFTVEDIYRCGEAGDQLAIRTAPNAVTLKDPDPWFVIGDFPGGDGEPFAPIKESPTVRLILRALEIGFGIGAQAGRDQLAGLMAEIGVSGERRRGSTSGWY